MPNISDTALLHKRLDEIRAKKAELSKEIEALNADEQRIAYALEVFRSVISPGLEIPGPAEPPARRVRVRVNNLPSRSLESAITEVLKAGPGKTSTEVADAVFEFTSAKHSSILSTLSRMIGKELVRREGKLHFPAGEKGEGPEVGTSEPSGATVSGTDSAR